MCLDEPNTWIKRKSMRGLIHSTLESPHLWQNDTPWCLHFLPKLTALNLNQPVKPPSSPQQRERHPPYRETSFIISSSIHQIISQAWHCIRFQSGLSGKWTWFVEERNRVALSHPSYHSFVMRCITLIWDKYHTLMHFSNKADRQDLI